MTFDKECGSIPDKYKEAVSDIHRLLEGLRNIEIDAQGGIT